MSVLDATDITPLRDLYVFANTPMFVYRRFREEPLVQQVSKRHTPEELVAAFNEHAAKAERSTDDVVRAYAALVALSLSDDYARIKSALGAAQLESLNWSTAIRDAVLGLYRPIARVEIQSNPSATIAAPAAPTGTSTSWAANLDVSSPSAESADQRPQPQLIILGERRK